MSKPHIVRQIANTLWSSCLLIITMLISKHSKVSQEGMGDMVPPLYPRISRYGVVAALATLVTAFALKPLFSEE